MDEIIHLLTEMAPFLLLGFLFAGLLHAFVPRNFYKKYLSGRGIRKVINAALLGIPLPLCSCGVIPTAMSLRKEGASKGATVSFLIATPQTGVDSIAATYSLMGLPFAIIRPIVAFFTAIFGGLVTNFVTRHEAEETTQADDDEHHCCCHHHEHSHDGEHEEHSCCHHHEHSHDEEHEGHSCCHHREHSHDEEHEEHSCCHHAEATSSDSFLDKLKVALRYAYIDMMEDIGKWLVVGLVVAAVITVAVPESLFSVFADNSLLSMLLVLAISIPMYVCATGSIPIAVALMMKGLTPGAGLVLLMAGPACNVASMVVLGQRLGRRTLIAYVVSIISGAVLSGLFIDYFLPRQWFTQSLQAIAHSHCQPSWWQWLCTFVLFALLVYVFIVRRFTSSKTQKHCCH